jgi:hypothetical protein
LFDETLNVAQRGVMRAMFELCPLRGGECSLESVEEPVHDIALTLVEGGFGMQLPESRLAQDGMQRDLRAVECAAQASDIEPQPLQFGLLPKIEGEAFHPAWSN